MTADPADPSAECLDASAEEAADRTRRAFKESLTATERGLTEAAKAAERVIREGLEVLRDRTKRYSDDYSAPTRETVADAQRYLVERINERPVTAAFAGVGIGLLLGLLLASRGR